MIDTAEQTTTHCLACGSPITQIAGRGHRKRLYCDDTCRQRGHRKHQAKHHTTIDEQELTRYRQIADLVDRQKMETRFMDLGKQVDFHALMEFGILGGSGYWQDFMRRADNDTLLKAIVVAEYFLEGLIALRGDPREARIATLEKEVRELQKRLNVEERFRTDVEVRHFKSWLRRRRLPQDADFLKLFLNDTRLPHHASRSMYIARLKQYGYTAEDISIFEEAWKDMLFNQS